MTYKESPFLTVCACLAAPNQRNWKRQSQDGAVLCQEVSDNVCELLVLASVFPCSPAGQYNEATDFTFSSAKKRKRGREAATVEGSQ